MSRQWRDLKSKGTALSKGSARGRKDLGEKATITNNKRALVFGNCHLALAGCTKEGIQASLPCPIFETGVQPTNAKAKINIGNQQVDVATDFLNQPDQWCQAFTFTYSHLLKVKQQPSPLEFIECMLFISRDRAYETLMRACEAALLALERSELRHFNTMLKAWDNNAVAVALSSPAAKEKALKDASFGKEDEEELEWMEEIIRKAKQREAHFPFDKLDPKNKTPSRFDPFLSYRTSNELFQIEAGVILGANPIAHLRNHAYGWLYYGSFFKSVLKMMHAQVFKDYGGISESVKNQISYLENDLDIKDSALTADKFFEKLNLMEIALRAFPLGHPELSKDNRIPDAVKKRITFNACREKYRKQLVARSKANEDSFSTLSWDEMQEVFIDCHRALAEEEKEQKIRKATEDKKNGNGDKAPKGAKRTRQDKDETTNFCQYCFDNGKKEAAHTHRQADCNQLKKLTKNKGSQNQPWKKQRVTKELNAILDKTEMSPDDLAAILKEKSE